MESDHPSDEWLMAAVQQGNRAYYATLMRRYATGLLTFIRRMVGDAHRSEELFQEVFLAVWTSREKYEPPRRFRSWLFGIAVNVCRSEFRRVRPTVSGVEGSFEGLVGREPSPAEVAVADETAAQVAAALAELPEGQRTVVVLRIWHGLEYAEIAEALERTEATVRSHMFHALGTLRTHLKVKLRVES